jgi:hypothetical protein
MRSGQKAAAGFSVATMTAVLSMLVSSPASGSEPGDGVTPFANPTAYISPTYQQVNAGHSVAWLLSWTHSKSADLATGDGGHLGPWTAASATNKVVTHSFCPLQTTTYTQTLKIRNKFGDVIKSATSQTKVIGDSGC